ncbi:MAG: glycosyltransferase family 2 protein [Erysipelotrichia bacterium]|nr:glycosyltransferase family 2 protein [Erysipelotrichia bacterium]
MTAIEIINKSLIIIFSVCYFYQFIYLIISLLPSKKEEYNDKLNKYAILIAARNEEKVIGNLLNSIQNQNYPHDSYDIYVCADNCTDNTAAIAQKYGAIVYERNNKQQIGKGYVLNYILQKIKEQNKKYSAYIVFDADNILDTNFLKEINRVYNRGYKIITSYRNSKNYGDNWISAGYGLWYLHESGQLSAARMRIKSSCSVNGTGFMFSQEILDKCGNWKFFLLTEDIEFSVYNITRGEKIGYAKKAILFDEQPTEFKQSFHQRLRWSKGYLQVLQKYGIDLISGMFRGSFSCYDMLMNIAPAAILSFISVIANILAFVYGNSDKNSLIQLCCSGYLTLFIIGLTTTITQWKQIYCSDIKKIFYMFTFPFFMLTYIPISLVALFTKVKWTPIEHNRNLNLKEIKEK